MLEVDGGIEQAPHFLPAQDGGELSPLLGFGHLVVKPGLLEGAGVEKLERGDANPESGPSQLSLIDEVQLVLADVLGAEVLG